MGDSIEAGAVTVCAACGDADPASGRAGIHAEALGVDPDAHVCPACVRWALRPVSLRVVARELAGDCVRVLRAHCVAMVLRDLPADPRDRRAALSAVAQDIHAGRWFGAGPDGRAKLERVVETLRQGRALGAARCLAEIDFARDPAESPADFAARHLRGWAAEQGADLGAEVSL